MCFCVSDNQGLPYYFGGPQNQPALIPQQQQIGVQSYVVIFLNFFYYSMRQTYLQMCLGWAESWKHSGGTTRPTEQI